MSEHMREYAYITIGHFWRSEGNFVTCWGSNPGHQAYSAITVPAEPSYQLEGSQKPHLTYLAYRHGMLGVGRASLKG